MKKIIVKGLAYDDVLVQPGFAKVLPADVSTQTKFSRNITMHAPISSSPMDTVTRSELAIRMAELGGIGVMDRNMPIKQQCDAVRTVKRSMSAVIANPYTLMPDHKVYHARAMMAEKKISGIPVINANGCLLGIVTRRDLKFENGDNTALSEIMTPKDRLITAPVGTMPDEAKRILNRTHKEKLLLVDDTFTLRGMITLKDVEKKNTLYNATLDASGQLRVAAAIGVTRDFFERSQELVAAGVDAIVLDTSHGHSLNVLNALGILKTVSGMVDMIVGNNATAKAARMLYEAGADALRVGIGPASICTTRIISGCGVPQITAIKDVAEEIEGAIPIIADGGIRYPGDITKAIAVGASSVMIGSLFAGTDESPGKKIAYQGQTYKAYRGMGSDTVLKSGGDRYGSKAVAEGIEARVPYRGPLADVFAKLVGGLRQGMGYAGCATIQELQENTILVQITDAGRLESHPHGVLVTNEVF